MTKKPPFLHSPHATSHSTIPASLLLVWPLRLSINLPIRESFLFPPLLPLQFSAPSLQWEAGPFQTAGWAPAVLWDVLWSHKLSQGDQHLWGLIELLIWSSPLSQSFTIFFFFFYQNFLVRSPREALVHDSMSVKQTSHVIGEKSDEDRDRREWNSHQPHHMKAAVL